MYMYHIWHIHVCYFNQEYRNVSVLRLINRSLTLFSWSHQVTFKITPPHQALSLFRPDFTLHKATLGWGEDACSFFLWLIPVDQGGLLGHTLFKASKDILFLKKLK